MHLDPNKNVRMREHPNCDRQCCELYVSRYAVTTMKRPHNDLQMPPCELAPYCACLGHLGWPENILPLNIKNIIIHTLMQNNMLF